MHNIIIGSYLVSANITSTFFSLKFFPPCSNECYSVCVWRNHSFFADEPTCAVALAAPVALSGQGPGRVRDDRHLARAFPSEACVRRLPCAGRGKLSGTRRGSSLLSGTDPRRGSRKPTEETSGEQREHGQATELGSVPPWGHPRGPRGAVVGGRVRKETAQTARLGHWAFIASWSGGSGCERGRFFWGLRGRVRPRPRPAGGSLGHLPTRGHCPCVFTLGPNIAFS